MSVLAILGMIGATIIFTTSFLFEKVRALFPKMFECPMCMGFWVGLLGAFVLVKPFDFITSFLTGCMISLLSYATAVVLHYLHKDP